MASSRRALTCRCTSEGRGGWISKQRGENEGSGAASVSAPAGVDLRKKKRSLQSGHLSEVLWEGAEEEWQGVCAGLLCVAVGVVTAAWN